MKIKRLLWIILGFIGLGIGAVGVVLPMLPAFPFLLLAAFSFGKSSERLHKWFIGTKLYKNNLESYVKGQGMTLYTKIKVMVTVRNCRKIKCTIRTHVLHSSMIHLARLLQYQFCSSFHHLLLNQSGMYFCQQHISLPDLWP